MFFLKKKNQKLFNQLRGKTSRKLYRLVGTDDFSPSSKNHNLLPYLIATLFAQTLLCGTK